MMVKRGKIAAIIIMIVLPFFDISAQISPGDLSTPHPHLEGLSNCTQCHILGNKVSGEKCLVCHNEVQERITSKKGYHVSVDVRDKQCFECHSDHHGKNFQLIRMDIKKFDHSLTGYTLSAPHSKKECKDCHDIKYISDQKIKAKKYTYMGVGTECLNCHLDYHQKTLSPACLNCHNPDAFKPATKFNHSDTKFQLVGKHTNVDCLKCHKLETVGGKKYQEFRINKTVTCSGCHKDPHQNKFGQNCSQCHNENTFLIIEGGKKFDHNKTDYKLEGKHLTVNCTACHKTKFSDPLKFNNCTNCHTDYHKGQFAKKGVSPDCSQCHSVKGFTFFSYTIEQHNLTAFPLQGSHVAVPCLDCHKKQKNWNFKNIGLNCKDCHKDIHQNLIAVKYYPEANCKICHNESRWNEVSFDHSKTDFALTGAHLKITCRNCHITKDNKELIQQKFTGLSKNCSDCHKDNHYRQFEKNGITSCTDCHDVENWKASKFDHSSTAFRLDGKHINVPCGKCHKSQQEGTYYYTRYKLKEYKCESCHF
jgi:predicted CXXCH cytochrome family protein